jgi:ketosteroid isomerase-like protein
LQIRSFRSADRARATAIIAGTVGQEHIDLIKQGYAAWNGGDRAWVLEHMRPDVEWVSPPDDPDPGTFRGYLGVQEFWDNWRELFGQLQFEPLEFEDLGDHVLVVARRLGIGNVSGVRVEEQVIQVFSFDEDKRCYKVSEYYDRDQARASVEGGSVAADGGQS